MALKPKTALLQIRMDPDLLAEFQRLCAANLYTPSDMARRLIHQHTTYWQKRELSAARYAAAKAKQEAMSPFLDVDMPAQGEVPAERPVASPAPSPNIRKANRRQKKGQR